MKKTVICAGMVAVALTHPAHAATLYLTDEAGFDGLFFAYGDHGVMQLRLDTAAIDTIQVAFLNAFLDAEGILGGSHSLTVGGVEPGQSDPWFYDRSAFSLPAAVSDDGDNEYGLIMGDQTIGGGFPLGAATWILDSLDLYDPVINVYEVTFEPGARQPAAYGPSPTYIPFTTAPDCLLAGLPNVLYMGAGNPGPLCGDPFYVDTGTPEPGTALLALTGIAIARCRSRGRKLAGIRRGI